MLCTVTKIKLIIIMLLTIAYQTFTILVIMGSRIGLNEKTPT